MNDKQKNGANTIAEAMKALASVKKMDIDPETGRILSRENKSILEDAYEKSNSEIPVEVKQIVEDKKEKLQKTLKPTTDTVAAYYSMINGKPKQQVIEEENSQQQKTNALNSGKLTVQKLQNEDQYMAALVAQIKKKR